MPTYPLENEPFCDFCDMPADICVCQETAQNEMSLDFCVNTTIPDFYAMTENFNKENPLFPDKRHRNVYEFVLIRGWVESPVFYVTGKKRAQAFAKLSGLQPRKVNY